MVSANTLLLYVCVYYKLEFTVYFSLSAINKYCICTLCYLLLPYIGQCLHIGVFCVVGHLHFTTLPLYSS
jgi:hypothetical protein